MIVKRSGGGQIFRFLRNLRNRASLLSLAEFSHSVHYDRNLVNPLTTLFDKYGSDKGSYRKTSDIYPFKPHHYADFYYELFRTSKLDVKLVFECGIGTNDVKIPSNMGAKGVPGASLRAFRDFFSQAEVFGGDIDEKCLFKEDRIQTFFLDQRSPQSISKFFRQINRINFDLIIDDGLHTFKGGVTLFENSFDKLKSDGVYVIEDVSFRDLLKYQEFFQNMPNVYVQYVSFHNRETENYRDNLIVIRKIL